MSEAPKEKIKGDGLVTELGAGSATNVHSDANARLEEMGYKQELKRNLGMVSILGLSFAIMAVPFGTSTTLNLALINGGPVTILWGVRIVRVVCSCELIVVGLCLDDHTVYRFESSRNVSSHRDVADT